MPEFLSLLPPAAALARLLDQIQPQSNVELIDSALALGRVTAEPILAGHPLPEFPRSTVDGYAVRAVDTHGASETLPTYLDLVGEVPMGAAAQTELQPAQCALIHTGGMLPPGADAVVMVEYTQHVRSGEVEVLRSLAVGENVIQIGEDVVAGQEVIPPGTRLRAAEIGGLMALGQTQVRVAVPPRVGILSSGDEIIAPTQHPAPGQVRDVNAFTLAAVVTQAGGLAVHYGIIADTRAAMLAAAAKAHAECDLVVITAGSSASTRDLTAEVIAALGQPGVLVHGINTRPGKPTILGVCGGKAIIGLPGNPVSALVNAGLFVAPVLHRLLGELPRLQASLPARLTVNLASQAGREDWIPVRLLPGPNGDLAEPIFGKSNLIFTLARADGLLKIPADANGLAAGATVQVILF